MDSSRIFFKIGDVAKLLDVKPSVLRFWEGEFPILAPEKGENGQRVYRRIDVETLFLIQSLLYDDGYSIEGARKRLRELRREGLLKSTREQVAAKRGFRPEPGTSAERAGEASVHAVGAQAAGPQVPAAVFHDEHDALEDLIEDVRRLQGALRKAPVAESA